MAADPYCKECYGQGAQPSIDDDGRERWVRCACTYKTSPRSYEVRSGAEDVPRKDGDR